MLGLRKVAWSLFPLFFIVVGGVELVFLIYSYHKANGSKEWHTVEGVTLVDPRENPLGYKYLAYSYSIQGKAYLSDDVIFGELGNKTPSDELKKFRSRSSGEKVNVYYDPSDFSQSILIRSVTNVKFFLIHGGVFFVGGCVCLAFLPKVLRMECNYVEDEISDRDFCGERELKNQQYGQFIQECPEVLNISAKESNLMLKSNHERGPGIKFFEKKS